MSMNWIEGMGHGMEEPGRPMSMAMPVFAGQKLSGARWPNSARSISPSRWARSSAGP